EVENNCQVYRTTFQVQASGSEVHISAEIISGDTCRALPLTLHALASAPGTFQWSDGSTADSLVIKEFGSYTVRLTNICGIAMDTFELEKPQADCCQPLFPNAFSPNGDGVNDRFSAIFEQCDLEYADFLVYDRWGELIFQGYEATQQWDGLTLNGTEAMSDVYVYVLHYKRRDQGQEQFEKGQVTLLR
ncbi:MAG: gliding motility-associated C-terminal domain-containing protein, partial [Saprospiraceae bacterium]